MSFINYVAKEVNCKIVYYGPGLGGKTTNLQYIYSKTSPDSKGKMVSLATETDRTLFFDFAPLDLGNVRGFTFRFYLFTVPGQVFYDASRKLVLKGVDGVIFVADSQKERMASNIESIRNLETNLKQHGLDLATLPYVLQLNKRDLPNALPADELYRVLNYKREPTFEAVAPSGRGVFDALKSVAKQILAELRNGAGKTDAPVDLKEHDEETREANLPASKRSRDAELSSDSKRPALGISKELKSKRKSGPLEQKKENAAEVTEEAESGSSTLSPSPMRVFISYRHDTAELKAEVLKLANRLRGDGVDARLDQYEASPLEGWPRWASKELNAADFVLIVCTPGYLSRFHGNSTSGEGKGVIWEANIIIQEIYDAGGVNRRFLPVVFSSETRSSVPAELRGSTVYEVDREDGYVELYRRITKQPEVEKPGLGQSPVLPARQ